MTAPSDRASRRWPAIALLVAACVYSWYALSQYSNLNDLNQRQLSNVGAELKTSLDNTLETIRQFNDKWNDAAGDKPNICDFVRGQPYLEFRDCATRSPLDRINWSEFTRVQWVVGSTLRAEVGGGANHEWLGSRLDRVLQELAFPDSFALILVATDKGDVLYQDAPKQRHWLRYLRWGEQRFRDAQADRLPTHQIQNVQQIVGGEAVWSKLRSVSSRTTVEVGGTDHLLYLQPLMLESDPAINLIIGGAVPRSSVLRDALALGAPLLGILVFLVLLGVLGFPFVKLVCLNERERFCLWDVTLVYVSTGALLVLFTCASLALDGYIRWQLEADTGLKPLAEHLETRFIGELEAIRDQLSEYDKQVSALPDSACDKWAVHANWFQSQKPGGLPWPAGVNLKTVAWIEPGGQQIWKSTADPVPGKVNVGQRVYFRAVRDENLFQTKAGGRPFFFAPDRSIADGKFYTFLSMKSDIKPTFCAGKDNAGGSSVVAATAQLVSLDRQPLPAGYGFVVVNREGRVLYHSDGRLSLRENLYEELSDGARMRAMTYAGGKGGGLDTRYRERPHRFYLHQISLSRASDYGHGADRRKPDDAEKNAGFYLAVFRDRSVEQALLGHVFVVGLASPMGLLLILYALVLGTLALAARRRGHQWSKWLWPHRGLDHIYRWQTVAFLVVLMASVGVYFMKDSVTPFLLAPFVAAALGLGIYWIGSAHTDERGSLSNPTWQRLSVFLVLVCMIVVPSVALFRVALSQEFAKLIWTESEWIRAQTEDRLRAARVGELEDRYAADRSDQLRLAREKSLSCVPAPFDAPSRGIDGPPTSPAKCRSDASATLQPIGVVTQLIELLHRVDQLLPIDNDILVRQHFRDVGQTYSPDGTIVRRFRASEITLASFALVLGLLYWWIGWNSNRVFLADLDAAPPPSECCEQIWTECTPEQQMVLLQINREHIASPFQRPIVKALLDKGLLKLAPEVQPFSQQFEEFLTKKAAALHAEIEEWQAVNITRSWRHGRFILASSVAGVGFFLILTQPGLQSSVLAVAGGMTGLLTAGSKLREAITSWLSHKSTP